MKNHHFRGNFHYKWQFSIAMLVCQRVVTMVYKPTNITGGHHFEPIVDNYPLVIPCRACRIFSPFGPMIFPMVWLLVSYILHIPGEHMDFPVTCVFFHVVHHVFSKSKTYISICAQYVIHIPKYPHDILSPLSCRFCWLQGEALVYNSWIEEHNLVNVWVYVEYHITSHGVQTPTQLGDALHPRVKKTPKLIGFPGSGFPLKQFLGYIHGECSISMELCAEEK